MDINEKIEKIIDEEENGMMLPELLEFWRETRRTNLEFVLEEDLDELLDSYGLSAK